MAKEAFKKAMKIISQRHQKALIDVEKRRSEVFQQIPAVKDLSFTLMRTGANLAKAIFNEENDVKSAVNRIKDENLRCQSAQRELLVNNGYPEDYLETKYYCSVCEDTGYVSGIKCECLKTLITKLNVAEFNSGTQLGEMSFDSFSINYYSDTPDSRGFTPRNQMGSILEFCKAYADKFDKHSPSVMMMGDTGLGKTHLSLSIANHIMLSGFSVLYISAPDLFRTLQNEYFGKGDPDRNTMNTVLDTDLLIVDDLGSEFENQFNQSLMYNIVNTRLSMSKPIIINTNLTPVEIEKRYGDRVASRLMTLYKCLKFMGKDVRQIKLHKQQAL